MPSQQLQFPTMTMSENAKKLWDNYNRGCKINSRINLVLKLKRGVN